MMNMIQTAASVGIPSADDTSCDTNTFYKTYKTTLVDGLETPYPPTAPAYCTRQSVKDMDAVSKDVTRKELDKLNPPHGRPPLPTAPLPFSHVTCTPAAEYNPDMHRMMCMYADKQQELCSQICDINRRLQKKQDESMDAEDTYRKKLSDLQDSLSHLREINEANEDDLADLSVKLKLGTLAAAQYKQTSERMWKRLPQYMVVFVGLYTALLLHAEQISAALFSWGFP
jgi:hypothetical protein